MDVNFHELIKNQEEKSDMQRSPRKFNVDFNTLNGKSILVTGATGSFGNAFIRRVLALSSPRRLVVFSRDEAKQFDLESELKSEGVDLTAVRFFLGDIRDENRLEMALNDIQIVVHAAALKHVPAAEYNPFECISTNVFGAENLVRACIRAGVEQVIALSTDKACSPLNLYGASKLASDKIFIAANNLSKSDGCKFSVVRYGNVLRSRGSVVPFFEKALREGVDKLPITHLDMTRFWITLSQGVDFVVSSLDQMVAGEIFIPKLPSIRIVDLATALAPHADFEIVGVRPGEKIHEMMLTSDDARSSIELLDRYVIIPQTLLSVSKERFAQFGGAPLKDGFSYTSDKNDDFLTIKEIAEWLRI